MFDGKAIAKLNSNIEHRCLPDAVHAIELRVAAVERENVDGVKSGQYYIPETPGGTSTASGAQQFREEKKCSADG